MTREEIKGMIERLRIMFEEKASSEDAEWYNNVAQGIAFATNSIPQMEEEN